MNIKVTAKELKATEAINEYVEKKLERIQKYFESDLDVSVTIRCDKTMQIAEMQISSQGNIFRATTETKDLYASIDKNIDILEGQIRKMKTKREKQNRDDSLKIKDIIRKSEHPVVEEEIIKTLYYDIKPMTPEDAILKLKEKPGNIFYTFINIETNTVNVIFKLKDSNNYGIVVSDGDVS